MSPPRRQLMLFLLVVGVALSAIPVVNVVSQREWAGSPQGLYGVDMVLPAVGNALRRVGVSAAPGEVVVGKSGWLFLGDHYEESVSVKRRPAGEGDLATAQRFADQTKAWDRWYREHGVETWRILICADKDSIYPDLLPRWDRPVDGTATDLAIQRADSPIVVDSRPALRQARHAGGLPLYLRTDTHWTDGGAWVAYRALAQSWMKDEPGLAWLRESDVALAASTQPSGDLAHLLSVSDDRPDASVAATVAPAFEAQRTQENTLLRKPVAFLAAARLKPQALVVFIRSPHALNARRLLWMRDSFGTAMLPFMAATFTEIVEVDRDVSNPQRVATLVAQFKPDLVLDSVAERNARSGKLQMPPDASAR